MKPGEVLLGTEPIVLNANRPTAEVDVENTSDHTIFVNSHYPFFEVNRWLVFDRAQAWGMHVVGDVHSCPRRFGGRSATVEERQRGASVAPS